MILNPAIQIRSATLEDSATITDFNLAMAAETENRQLDAATLSSGVQRVFSDPEKGFYLVAEKDGTVVGSLMITHEWSDWRNGSFWWIQSVYVLPETRCEGIFTALFQEVLSRARKAGDTCGIRLYVEQENQNARQVYSRLGMAETGYRLLELDWRQNETPSG